MRDCLADHWAEILGLGVRQVNEGVGLWRCQQLNWVTVREKTLDFSECNSRPGLPRKGLSVIVRLSHLKNRLPCTKFDLESFRKAVAARTKWSAEQASSRPFHLECIDFLCADIASEQGGTVRSHGDRRGVIGIGDYTKVL